MRKKPPAAGPDAAWQRRYTAEEIKAWERNNPTPPPAVPRVGLRTAIRHWRKDSRDDIRRAGRVAGRDRREDALRKARRALLEK